MMFLAAPLFTGKKRKTAALSGPVNASQVGILGFSKGGFITLNVLGAAQGRVWMAETPKRKGPFFVQQGCFFLGSILGTKHVFVEWKK